VRENDRREIESRRACPELVERGRLSPGRSPGLASAIEKSRRDDRKSYRDVVLDSGSGSGILIRGIFEMELPWDRLRVTSSRPSGTFHRSNPYPGLRPGPGVSTFSQAAAA
jgi:hypothetical protein